MCDFFGEPAGSVARFAGLLSEAVAYCRLDLYSRAPIIIVIIESSLVLLCYSCSYSTELLYCCCYTSIVPRTILFRCVCAR